MKNILNLTGMFCLFAILIFTSCSKENTVTNATLDIITEKEAIDFMNSTPSIEEAQQFFAKISPTTTSNETITSIDDLSSEQKELFNIHSNPLEQAPVSYRICGDITAIAGFNGLTASFGAFDPTNSTNNYIAILTRNGTTIDYSINLNTAFFFFNSTLPDCGNYVAYVFAQENEPGCPTAYQQLATATKNLPDCF